MGFINVDDTIVNNAFTGKQRLVSFFNRSNHKNPILSIQPAGVSNGRNGFRKDKSNENLAESEEDLLEHRTNVPMCSLPLTAMTRNFRIGMRLASRLREFCSGC